jgi:hypothetical protein
LQSRTAEDLLSTILQRLFRPRAPEGDLAVGDWTPPPPSAVARPEDPVSWLTEEPIKTAVAASRVMFSPEELAVIEEQKHAQASVVPAPPPAPAPPRAESPPRASWIEVLKAYAEHLTDAELHILREQLQG